MTQINNYEQLMAFLEDESTNLELGVKVANKALGAFFDDRNKEQLLTDVRQFIKEYGDVEIMQRPLFGSESAKDNSKEFKRINDELERKY